MLKLVIRKTKESQGTEYTEGREEEKQYIIDRTLVREDHLRGGQKRSILNITNNEMGLAGQFGGRAPASIYKTLGSILVSGNRRNKTKPKIQLVESH